MSALIQLSGLRLVCNTEWDADSCNVLLQLPALRSLDISNFYVLPSCLGQLTALEELVLIQSPESGDDETLAAELNAALPQLERLTSLLIDAWEIQAGLPALTSLFRLHRLYLNGGSELPLSLPAGPWMGSLRELGASWTYLCASTQALAAAAQLERVAVVNGLDAQVQPSPQLFGWLAEHPPLRDLEMYPGDEGLHGSMRSAVAGLKQGRPGLQVALIHEAALDAVFRASCRTLLDFF